MKTALLGIALLSVLACHRSKSGSSAGSDAAKAPPAAVDHEVRPVYPVDTSPPDPLALQLCDALHTLPEGRKAKCCGETPSVGQAGECARNLTGALKAKAVTLVEVDVAACASASASALEGCDWVTPLSAPLPPACSGIIHGELARGTRCRSVVECKDGLTCRGSSPTQTGVCADPSPVGGGCGGTADPLVAYTRQLDREKRHPECAGWCERGACAPFAGDGQACRASKQCARGHCRAGKCSTSALPKTAEPCFDVCEAPAACLAGKCAVAKSAGEACSNPFECKASCVGGKCGMKCSGWPPSGYPYPGQPKKP